MLRTDQENTAHDEDSFDPSYVHRDYREVAKKLRVFCVSSKAYQKISGRLEKDGPVTGFTRLADTEIPALQQHALGIVHETRAVTCRRFLDDLSRFLTSLHLQVVQSDQPLKIADDLRVTELQALAEATDGLKKVLTLEHTQPLQVKKTGLTYSHPWLGTCLGNPPSLHAVPGGGRHTHLRKVCVGCPPCL